jgi:hypothetical protein
VQQTMRTVGVVVMVITGLVCGGIVGMAAAAQGLESRVTTLEQEVAALQQPASKSVIFAFNRPFPFNSDPVDTSGDWTKLTMSIGVSAGGFICGYALQIPDGSGGWIEQIRVRCDCGASCDPTVVPVISDTMRLSTGTASGSLTAAGLLEK